MKSVQELRNIEIELENLAHYIPGGIHSCRNDSNLTLQTMSDSFLEMFGYTREDIKNLFDDKFMNMIYSGDRENVTGEIIRQLQKGLEVELEYRVRCKDGVLKWILDKGRLQTKSDGNKCFYCILVEITDRKKAQEELRLSLQRHQVIVDQTTDIIFEWDIQRDTLEYSPNWIKKFGYEAINSDISSHILCSSNIHKEDLPVFVKIMKDISSGVPYSETEFRIRSSKGRYLWCCIRVTAQFDDNGKAIKAVGVIIDIDADKRQKQLLLEQAEKDALTGLYNKVTINTLVSQKMSEKECSQALMIIDVDNFKAVNDTYGHLSGDSLLSNIAAVLKNHISESDMAGRIGGDEFLVYLSEVFHEGEARARAENILEALHMLKPDCQSETITCSIGVTFFKGKTIAYNEAYKQADLALYNKKNSGRCGISFFAPHICSKGVSDSYSGTAVGESIGSSEGNVVDEELAQYVFRTLYEAKDTELAIKSLLSIIGCSCDVSRVYIFENMQDKRYMSVTYEWCGEGIEPQKESMQYLSYTEDLGNYQKNFTKRGVFHCPDIEKVNPKLQLLLKSHGVYSTLQCAILEEGEFLGGVVFDECRGKRSWDRKQTESFKLTANVLASFVIRMRLKQRIQNELKEK